MWREKSVLDSAVIAKNPQYSLNYTFKKDKDEDTEGEDEAAQ